MILTLVAVVAFGASVAGVGYLKRWAPPRLLDIPGARSSHVQPTPRGGGIAIVLVVVVSSALFVRTSDVLRLPFIAALSGALLIAAVSLLDDLYKLPWLARMAVHLLAAALLVKSSGPLPVHHLISMPQAAATSVDVVVSILWVVGLTNAYNFMDGIDGIAAAQAIVAGVGWTLIGWFAGQPILSATGMAIAAASAGFLIYNRPPATIFMGDVGSAFLGYMFAALGILVCRVDEHQIFAGPLLVWPFIFDTMVTLVRRIHRGEHLFTAHRSHLYQRLVIGGLSHSSVTLLYTALAMIGLAAAIALALGHQIAAMLAIACIGVGGAADYALAAIRDRKAT